MRTAAVAPTVSADAFAKVIVINRSVNRLYLYKANKLFRTFPVATGQAIYPTPAGVWRIVDKQRNPWWRPPNSDWAKGLKPIPPGPSADCAT